MRYFVATSIVVVLLTLLASNTGCGGRVETLACNRSDEGPGWNPCSWDPSDVPPGRPSEVCCPPSAPYCGGVGLDCPPGYCCVQQPIPGPVSGGPVDTDAGTD